MIKIQFVCLGNICRSPTAHAIAISLAKKLNLNIEVHSAGTSSYHIGESPDARAIKVALQQGYDLRQLKAEQIQASDFYKFDYIVAMDNSNYSNLTKLAPSDAKSQIVRIADYHPNREVTFIPDPYYDRDNQGFEKNIALLEQAIDNLFAEISS